MMNPNYLDIEDIRDLNVFSISEKRFVGEVVKIVSTLPRDEARQKLIGIWKVLISKKGSNPYLPTYVYSLLGALKAGLLIIS
jgi:hypothetical protein